VKHTFGSTGLKFFSDFDVVITYVLGRKAAIVTAAEGEILLCLRQLYKL
jgi:hypothetical protein